MSSQRLDSLFLKSRRLQFIENNGRSPEQASRLAIRSKSVTHGFKDLRAMPGSRQDLGDQQHSLAELPRTSHGKRKPDRLPHLTSCASKGLAPDPKLNLSIISKRVFQANAAEGPEHRQTLVGPTGLLKNSPDTTAGEAQGKRRTMELLSKARKQTEKASVLLDIRQLQKQEVVMNTEHPSKKHQQPQPKILEELRRGRLGGGDNSGLTHSQGPFRYCGCLALEENTFLQGKKIKPYSRYSVQIACPLLVGEQRAGEEPKPVPSDRDEAEAVKASKGRKTQTQLLENVFLQGKAKVMGQNLLAEAKSQLLKRKRMQAVEMLAKTHHHRGFCIANSREDGQLSSQDIKQGALERNTMKPRWWPRVEAWDHMVQGTPVVLAVRDHTSLTQGSKDQSAPKSRLSLLSKSSITYS
ncbi:protein Tex24-like [Apodemus sylvaticus]|uniref:protein Tex24-like n=1 Tax=Apodemus sylvaticus TaxID=10129 RepID=UPI0022449007|nr:protein Tex24-like [Apodemus sylvaticus]